jgi:hypothetical protein
MNHKAMLRSNLLNIPGWRTNRRIVVIESDDWGSIRMPSKDVYFQLYEEGYNPGIDPYLKYDSLANEIDLVELFDILSSVQDKNGNPAIITANCVMSNPDFTKIKESNFTKYYNESFIDTLKRYPEHHNSFRLFKEGIKKNLVHPQFHAREHLNVSMWMKGLKNGDKLLHKAFDLKMISISSIPSKMRFGYMESLDFFDEKEKEEIKSITIDGLNQFEQIFGYKSKSFIASCYTWSSSIEPILLNNGVLYIQGIANQIEPVINRGVHSHIYKRHFLGNKNTLNQAYLVRNIFFEPSQNIKIDWINECMKRIKIAFRWNKPAIICSHRLNFVGFIDPQNRYRNLLLFSLLLKEIKKCWPQVEFMTSEALGDLINS